MSAGRAAAWDATWALVVMGSYLAMGFSACGVLVELGGGGLLLNHEPPRVLSFNKCVQKVGGLAVGVGD